jgi:hypothetical protein
VTDDGKPLDAQTVHQGDGVHREDSDVADAKRPPRPGKSQDRRTPIDDRQPSGRLTILLSFVVSDIFNAFRLLGERLAHLPKLLLAELLDADELVLRLR